MIACHTMKGLIHLPSQYISAIKKIIQLHINGNKRLKCKYTEEIQKYSHYSLDLPKYR